MPRLKAVTDANGVKFYPTTITHGVFDTERNQKLTATLDAIYRTLQYSDVYIGAAAAYSSIISSSYHYDSIVRGRPINISNASSDYIWVVLPADYSPVVLLSGIEMKISLEGTTTISSKSYKIWKSTNIYTGTFNLYLL